MNFYKLTYPDYKSDMEHNAKNPAKTIFRLKIPTIICPICKQWGSLDIIDNINPAADKLDEFKTGRNLKILPAEEWFKKQDDWAKILGIPKEDIIPGAVLAPNDIVISRSHYGDFLFPDFSHVLVKEAVVDALQKIKVTGVEFRKAQTQWSKKMKNPPLEKPQLWELIVHGHNWSIGMEGKPIITCKICGRTKGIKGVPVSDKLVIDISKWDKSDIFNLNYSRSYVVITERVKYLLEEYNFSNYRCIPLPNED